VNKNKPKYVSKSAIPTWRWHSADKPYPKSWKIRISPTIDSQKILQGFPLLQNHWWTVSLGEWKIIQLTRTKEMLQDQPKQTTQTELIQQAITKETLCASCLFCCFLRVRENVAAHWMEEMKRQWQNSELGGVICFRKLIWQKFNGVKGKGG
jgi:hypothetical protein